MYQILKKMKKRYSRENWLKMVEQAKERGKLTEEEYEKLLNDRVTKTQLQKRVEKGIISIDEYNYIVGEDVL